MASNLGCVGLAVADAAELAALVNAITPDSRSLGRVDGVDVRRWEDPSGARLVFGRREDTVVEFLPSFAGRVGGKLRALGRVGPEVARAAVVDAAGDTATRVVLEVEQRRLLPPEPVAHDVRATITALGVDVAVFDDADAFAASPASLVTADVEPGDPPARYVELGLVWPPRMAAESFVSYGEFVPADEATAHARLAGAVRSADVRTVSQTGQRFVAAEVATAGFEATVCFPADEGEAPPRPGNVLHGTVYLVASVDLPTASPSRPLRTPFRGRRRGRGRRPV